MEASTDNSHPLAKLYDGRLEAKQNGDAPTDQSDTSRGSGTGSSNAGTAATELLRRRSRDKAAELLGAGDDDDAPPPPSRNRATILAIPGEFPKKADDVVERSCSIGSKGSGTSGGRRVSFNFPKKQEELQDAAAKTLENLERLEEGNGSAAGVGGAPASSSLRKARYTIMGGDMRRQGSFERSSFESAGSRASHSTRHTAQSAQSGTDADTDGSELSASKRKRKGIRRKARRTVNGLMKSLRKLSVEEEAAPDLSNRNQLPRVQTDPNMGAVHFERGDANANWSAAPTTGGTNFRRRVTGRMSAKWIGRKGLAVSVPTNAAAAPEEESIPERRSASAPGPMPAPLEGLGRKSMSAGRRENLDAKALTMGLDLESAQFLDFMSQAKCQEWLKSLSRRDPRACIKAFFDDVARDGADNIEAEGGFQPELLSPLLSMFQRSSVFSVWRPTSVDSIRRMMTGQGTGKGLDIKGKSAKKGKLSAYVPFLQIHEDEHKTKIRALPRDGRIRVFYKKREARDNALKLLRGVLGDMTEAVNLSLLSLKESKNVSVSELRGSDVALKSFQALNVSMNDLQVDEDEQRDINIVNNWSMETPNIVVIDDYTPKCYGLDMPKRLFWEGYVMRAKDISRQPGSVYDTGRPSRAEFQDMNFNTIKNEAEDGIPRAVVWQYTDPYLPHNAPDPDPMMPQTLLMAYEEHGRVMPVVSDFDCFLLGTRGVRFHSPLPEEQVELVHGMIGDIETILDECSQGKSHNWTASWLHVMKHHKRRVAMPRYGFGDPKSYAIMKYAVNRLEEFGAVRHGAECFNFYFPQELDDEFLVIGGNLGGAKYKYMKLPELQTFLSGCIDLGFTFPLNPKWVLCDQGWKALWDKLTGSTHPNVQLSINAWYPPGSKLKERIHEVHTRYPKGFQSDLSGRKKGTQAWDEAEIAFDRYQRIQRAKRKLWAVMVWIGTVQLTKKAVVARRESQMAEGVGEGIEVELAKISEGLKVQYNSNGAAEVGQGSPMEVAKGGKRAKRSSILHRRSQSNDAHSDKRVSFHEQKLRESGNSQLVNFDMNSVNMESYRNSANSQSLASLGADIGDRSDSSGSIRTPTIDAIASLGQMNATVLGRARSADDGRMPRSVDQINERALSRSDRGMRRSSSLTSDGTEENLDLIESLLGSNLPLSEYQTMGLQRLRNQMGGKPTPERPRINNRFERRHTSIDCRIDAMMLEEVPSFILREYGGAKGEGNGKFSAQVQKIMHAQRLINAVKEQTHKNVGDHFLPVEWTTLSRKAKEGLAEMLTFKELARWEYNIIQMAKLCNGSPLLFIGWAIIGSPHAQQAMANDLGREAATEGYNFISEFSVQAPILCSFLRTVEADYLPNPYHNNTHAADVVQTLNTMLQLGGKDYASSPLDIFSILVAAVIHDVKHPGLNNNFQINSRSELAVQYNDVSVLENSSITWLFSKLLGTTRDFTVDIFSGLSKEQFSKARSIIIRSVLETDMTHHFALLKKMGRHQEMLKGKERDAWHQSYTNEGVNYDPSSDMLCFLLHQADISNPAKPYPLCVEWADSILEECYAQGDKEQSLSLPVSPLCDRVTTDKKQSQIGFIKFVVQPSYRLLGEIIPLFAKTVFPHIERSLAFWDNHEEDSSSWEEEEGA